MKLLFPSYITPDIEKENKYCSKIDAAMYFFNRIIDNLIIRLGSLKVKFIFYLVKNQIKAGTISQSSPLIKKNEKTAMGPYTLILLYRVALLYIIFWI